MEMEEYEKYDVLDYIDGHDEIFVPVVSKEMQGIIDFFLKEPKKKGCKTIEQKEAEWWAAKIKLAQPGTSLIYIALDGEKVIKRTYPKRTIEERQANYKKIWRSTTYKPDKLKKEIDEFIELALNQLNITGQAVYQVNQSSSKRKVLREKPVDVFKIDEQVEKSTEDLCLQSDDFFYDTFFQNLDAIKEGDRVILAELEGNGACDGNEAAAEDDSEEFYIELDEELDEDEEDEDEGHSEDHSEGHSIGITKFCLTEEKVFHSEGQSEEKVFSSKSAPVMVENPIQTRVKRIVHDIRKNHEWVEHSKEYEDLVLGVILLVMYENPMENRTVEEALNISEFVEQLWGSEYKKHITNIFKEFEDAKRIYL